MDDPFFDDTAGGIVMTQDAGSAKFDGMPRSAISTGLGGSILSPGRMPEELLKYIEHPFIRKGDRIESPILKDEDTLSKILSIIRDRTNVDFTCYKPNTIVRRIERRISINQIEKIEDYIDFLSQSCQEAMTLHKELLIGVTKFFRDAEVFDAVRTKVIPKLCEQGGAHLPLRIWSVGCSTGEETYSLAILFREYLEEAGLSMDVKVFATDIDKESIEYAGVGLYPESIVADVSPERLKRFFSRKDGGYQINEKIRRMVVFALHNIINDPPFSRMDLISCRNLLIYFQPVMQKKVLSSFHFALNRGGCLLLGNSETIGDLTSVYLPVDSKGKVYQHKDSFKAGQFPPALTHTFRRDTSSLKVNPAAPHKVYSLEDVELYSAEDAKDQRIRDLEQELRYTRENLQATIGELETSNEELYTVNSEYQKKIDELTELNNDILNLLRNTSIGTVFLDNNLHIRKYTPAVSPVMNIMDMDIGRPVHHISHNFSCDGFFDDIGEVLRTLVPRQLEVQTKNQTWYLIKVIPYRTLENAVGGIVITFIDINERKQFEEQLRRERDLLIRVLESSPVGKVMVNREGKVTFANRRAGDILGLDKAMMIRGIYTMPAWRIFDAKGARLSDDKDPFKLIIGTKLPIRDYVYFMEGADGRRLRLLLNGAPEFDERGEVTGAVFSIDDITDAINDTCWRKAGAE
ncbi:MAG: CheR family methyltransferase [Nitrospirota bacterium]